MQVTESDSTEGLKPFAGKDDSHRRDSQRVTFYAPSLKPFETSEMRQDCGCTVFPVSITGSECSLMCDHCRGRILAGMHAATTPDELFAYAREHRGKGGGLLVSGGSDRRGRVPLEPFMPVFGRIRDELGVKIAVHTGVTGTALAEGLAAADVDSVLIDIIGSDSTIREICHIEGATTDDYSLSLSSLCGTGLRVVPHVVIGLQRGAIRGETDALEMIVEHDVAAVVLVGLRPLPGTPMEGVSPPEPAAMGRVFRAARSLFPDRPVLLGCERPAGAHKEETDRLALEAGLDGIAYPADGAVARARTMGLEPRFSGMCCAMSDEGESGADEAEPDRGPAGYGGEEPTARSLR